jgi:hypothetical protein
LSTSTFAGPHRFNVSIEIDTYSCLAPSCSPTTGAVLEGNDVEGVLCIAQPWPSIARTVYKDHARYLETYMKPYPGTYFTGDGAGRDKDGYIWIKGRVDGACSLLSRTLCFLRISRL